MEHPSVLQITSRIPAAIPSVFPVTPLPGRIALLEEPVEKRGELFLPASGRLNSDTMTVAASGVSEIVKGDRVCLCFGAAAAHMNIDGADIRLTGLDPWYWYIPCRVETAEKVKVIPVHDWVLIRRFKKEQPEGLVVVPDVSAWQDYLPRGQVLAYGTRVGFDRRAKKCADQPVHEKFRKGCVVEFVADRNATPCEMYTFKFESEPDLALIPYSTIKAIHDGENE